MKLISSAFPPGKAPLTHSKVHELLQKHLQNHPFPQATIRKYEVSDIQQLKLLQKEWFPLNYTDQFYVKILEGAAECYVAEVLLTPDPKQKPERAIVGALVFEITSETDHLVDNWLSCMLGWKNNAIYIMTLGVIDQMRSKGLAKKLFDEIIIYAMAHQNIQIVSLHVVAYNKRAINFYKKNGFVLLENLEEHYHIMNQQFSGLKLGYFVNGGQRRQGWIPWLKRIILKKEMQDVWPQ